MNAVVLVVLSFAAPVDFDTQVLPVLARAGCNAGACHGAAAGRGGFRLSLFGGDPSADYRAIIHELEGRRINLARPERSLLLLKPTWELDHEGGQRFESDSSQAKLLIDWIAAGAPRTQARRVTQLVVEPKQVAVTAVPAEVSLAVWARLDDGSSRRVEEVALFTPADPTATTIDARGSVRVLRPGRHAILVRYLTHVEAVQITAPHPAPPLDLSQQPRGNWIDDEIYAALEGLRLPPSPRADEAALLRRVTLDLSGRLPTPARVREHLADGRSQPEKYAAEVDRLLASPEFAEYWTYKFARWLRVQTGPNDVAGTQALHGWLRKQIETGRPLDRWAAELLTADGDSHAHGPANFHRNAGDARAEAEYVAEALLGIRLRCANCHNHPLDRWTQDDYHGLAAIFARLDRGTVVRMKATGEVIHPATGEVAQPRIPGERFLPAEGDNRPALAQWLTSSDHRRFAKAQVNRLWQAMFGRGLIDPVDDVRDSNPATHPELLDLLADDFLEHDCDLRQALRLIAASAAYQRSARPLPAAKQDERFYSHALERPLPPEVLLDAVAEATGIATVYKDGEVSLSGMRAIGLYTPQLAASALGPLAQCGGVSGCPAAGESPPTLSDLGVQLHWINGPLVNARLADNRNALAQLAASNLTVRELIDEYYLRTLSRLPTSAEAAHWLSELEAGDRASKCQDFAWSLLSCREFVTNH